MKPKELLANYCSCVLQVKGDQGQRQGQGQDRYSPYAVCTKSVYQRRSPGGRSRGPGGRSRSGPGAVACRFTRQVLRSYDAETLRGWLRFEGVLGAAQVAELSKRQLVDTIHAYLQKKPKIRVKTVLVEARQGARRRSPQPRGREQ